MELKTKHRIIGIVVLIALAVIIVPLFFSRSGSEAGTQNLSAHMSTPPGKPDIEQIAIPLQQPTTNSKPATVAPAADLATQPLQPNQNSNNNAPLDPKVASEELASNINSATAAAAAPAPAAQANLASAATNNALPEKVTAKPVSNTAVDAVPKAQPLSEDAAVVPAPSLMKPQQIQENRNKAGVVKRRLADAWAIQLGSFTEKKNAESLVKQLRAKGYAAYLNESKTSGVPMIKVYIGPEEKREKADAMVKELHETLNLKAVVVKYTA